VPAIEALRACCEADWLRRRATKAALSRAGRYAERPGSPRVKEVRVGEHERFVVCASSEAAARDPAVPMRLVARLGEMIAGSERLTPTKRAELRGVISTT
jgi:hypothetical protein